MNSAQTPVAAPVSAAQIAVESTLGDIERRLADCAAALRSRDAAAIEQQTTGLHRAMTRAAAPFAAFARSGPVPPGLQARLATARADLAVQRETVARASAAVDRALHVLLPHRGQELYSNAGSTERTGPRGGVVQA